MAPADLPVPDALPSVIAVRGARHSPAGTPEEVVRAQGSVTGPWLAEHLGLPPAR
jgi:hypothetical protein